MIFVAWSALFKKPESLDWFNIESSDPRTVRKSLYCGEIAKERASQSYEPFQDLPPCDLLGVILSRWTSKRNGQQLDSTYQSSYVVLISDELLARTISQGEITRKRTLTSYCLSSTDNPPTTLFRGTNTSEDSLTTSSAILAPLYAVAPHPNVSPLEVEALIPGGST